ncbi:MAG: DUF350 domain-containing protein [Candidatus Coatesbacteria bacterium]|nr:DUF350 domain-containing protein [Candidatus Coatesbacteria bacterium]
MLAYIWEGLVNIGSTLIYCVLGFVMLGVGYKIFEFITPYDFDRQITEDKNVPLGIIAASVIISVALITIFVLAKYVGRIWYGI